MQSRRPVYNSSYTTTMLNFRDTEFEFTYQEYDPLVHNEMTMENNLTGVLDFYVYMILGIDFDSFSYKGGEYFFKQAENLVTMGQSTQEIGWTGFGSSRNRHALMSAFIENRNEPFRQLWYTYHRLGLDEMALSVDKGRSRLSVNWSNFMSCRRRRCCFLCSATVSSTRLSIFIPRRPVRKKTKCTRY